MKIIFIIKALGDFKGLSGHIYNTPFFYHTENLPENRLQKKECLLSAAHGVPAAFQRMEGATLHVRNYWLCRASSGCSGHY